MVAADPDGNTARSASAGVVVSGEFASPYAERVIGDGALQYWPLDETADVLGTNPGVGSAGVTSISTGVDGSALAFSGYSSGRVVSS